MNAAPIYFPARTLMAQVTDDCNLRCNYCYVLKQPRTMTMTTARKAIDFILDRNISGGQYDVCVCFFGGECFLAQDILEEMIRYAREPKPGVYKFVRFTATTSGTIAGPRVERMIRDTRMSLLVSMDGGVGASSHRPLKSGRSSYSHLVRNLPKLVSWSSDVVVRMTIHPGSMRLTEEIRHLFEIGAPSIAACPVLESDWAAHEDELNDSYSELAEWYVSEARAGRIPALEITNRLLQDYHLSRRGLPRPERPCGVGGTLVAVDPDGNVMPCHRFLYRRQDWIGHVDRSVFDEARMKYVHLTSRDFLECSGCLAEPICGGGCRLVALNAGRALNEVHPPYCVTKRAHVRAVMKIYSELSSDPDFVEMLETRRRLSNALTELAIR